ncbi:hypothetical protein IWQ62_003108 [Dispira parvispora]|uniref:Dynein intermediate chain n=1 Tax=Dispira parvispora TaxID=1520584 RepID=A0A9W8AP29_9FUNG|nr:hypothetical protein IWQ62_003108 [Dispira parvispora]
MERRREELHRKKQRLAEIRRLRVERQQTLLSSQTMQTDSSTAPTRTTASTSTSSGTGRGQKDIDDLVASLLGDRLGSRGTNRSRGGSLTQSLSEPGQPADRTPAASTPTPTDPLSPSGPSPLSVGARAAESPGVPSTPCPKFTVFDTVILDLPPKERLSYNKEAQTMDWSPEPAVIPEEEIERRVREQREKDEKARRLLEEQEQKRQEELQRQRQKLKELSEEEKQAIEQSAEFTDFMDFSSKLVERALNEPYDFMTDYTIGSQANDDTAAGNQVKLFASFRDDRWSKNRSVTDVAWSKRFPELVASSYNRNPMAMNEPDGIVCVWNLHLRDRPEFVFHSQSDVLCVAFSEFQPTLLVGGTYAGQILLWDTRAKSQPVLKTPLSAAGHTHPVYSLDIVGTQNAHNLVSASTDGLVCTWQLDMLAKPQEMLELVHPAHARTDEVSPTAMGFPDGETATFWVGTEEGHVYQANRHDRAGSKAGLNTAEVYRGHSGPVTSLHFHPSCGPVDCTDLFLTSSVDWTVKLWRAKATSKASSLAHQQRSTLLHSFETADDYVYDAKWSPLHPAVFGTVTGSGQFELWNLNNDTEAPVLSTTVGANKALNRLAWDKHGRKVALGSIDSMVYVYDIGEMVVPKHQDFTDFQRTVTELAATPVQLSSPGDYAFD